MATQRIVFEEYISGNYASDKELASIIRKILSDFDSWKNTNNPTIISINQTEFKGPTHDPYDGKWGYKIEVLYSA